MLMMHSVFVVDGVGVVVDDVGVVDESFFLW
jgi:hypothetical protein